METADRKVRMSPELMERWASRDTRGHLLTWDWGEPDEEGFYTPAITTVDDGVRLVTAESLARALPEDWEPFWDEMPTVGNAEGFREHAVEFNHERFAAAILQALDSA